MEPTRNVRPDVVLRPFRSRDLPAVVSYWNRAFSDRRNFHPVTNDLFRRRIEGCSAFDPSGLILAWKGGVSGSPTIVGLVQAFRPPPDTAVYRRWGRHHSIALLYVSPQYRRRGVGSRLLKAAEQWLYYCPVHFAGQSVPCAGSVEGPRQPLFGSTQRMGVSAHERELLHFLAKRGYTVIDPGDVSMTAQFSGKFKIRARKAVLMENSLRLIRAGSDAPFQGSEPPERAEYSIWGANPRYPYAAAILVDETDTLRGHLCWYPLQRVEAQAAGIYGFWLAPALRGKGLGSLLLDSALYDITRPSALGGPFEWVEVQTHVVRHPDAVALYESRGFHIDEAWVTLVKT